MNWRCLIAGTMLATGFCGMVIAAEPLKIGPLLSSLLKVQDRIAAGDAAALPLQQHLMKLLDAAIAEAGGTGKVSAEEFRALVIFGIAGTGSRAVIDALREVKTKQSRMDLAAAVVDYRNRKQKQAIRRFAEIEDAALDDRLAPFVSFAKANLLTRAKPGQAIKYYNLTRLSAPGTLLEEASLRRLMSLHKKMGQGVEFMIVAKQYARRFPKSPYRKQYISMLQSGILPMRRTIPLEDIGDLGRLMPTKFAVAFHMRLIRDAIVSGHMKLAEFSISEIVDLARKSDEVQIDEERLALFKVLSRMTSESPHAVLLDLDAIDKTKLNADDKNLLNGARRIIESILAPIDETQTGIVNGGQKPPETQKEAVASKPEMSSDASSRPPKPAMMGDSETNDEIENFIDSTQKRLTVIDGILNN